MADKTGMEALLSHPGKSLSGLSSVPPHPRGKYSDLLIKMRQGAEPFEFMLFICQL